METQKSVLYNKLDRGNSFLQISSEFKETMTKGSTVREGAQGVNVNRRNVKRALRNVLIKLLFLC